MPEIAIANIYRFEGDSALKAFCDVIVSGSILIKGIRVVEGRNGLFVRMPAKQGKDGKWYESIQPMTQEIRDALSQTIIEAFNG
ncbi:MAG: septation protein SpoVG family protein [Candidatus Omnitrophica bacterium]|nr:septation protein SpoVG family protein [Candidatus Omnitrophota bacterium]